MVKNALFESRIYCHRVTIAVNYHASNKKCYNSAIAKEYWMTFW